MAKQVILGTDFGKDALKVKCNANFTELYEKDVELEGKIVNDIGEHDTNETAHEDIRQQIGDLAGDGRTTETVKKNADDILNKMPISTSAVGAVGEFKKIQNNDGTSLSLPSGGTWEYQAYWIQTSTGYAAFIGGGAGGIEAGGTQILSAQTGYTPVAFVRRIL